jgi:hypothetical protein
MTRREPTPFLAGRAAAYRGGTLAFQVAAGASPPSSPPRGCARCQERVPPSTPPPTGRRPGAELPSLGRAVPGGPLIAAIVRAPSP